MQDYIKERAVDLQSTAVVVNEAQFSEPVHEKADPGAGRADHFRQCLLAYLGYHRFGYALLPKRASSRRMRASRFSLELNS